MSQASSSSPPRPAQAPSAVHDAANDSGDVSGPGLPSSAIAAVARGWPGAALAVDASGRILGASPLSGYAERMRAPFDLPAAGVASQVTDSAGRNWRLSVPVDGVRLATTDHREEPDAAHRFTAAVSHEIRTPLNGILGMAALLEEEKLSPAQLDYVSAIRKSGARLLDLLNNVLDYSRMEAGDIPLEHAPFDPADLVQDVAELLAPRAHAAGVDIAACAEPGLAARFTGDAGRLRQVLFNLAGNSVKFSENGSVLIEACAGPGGQGLSLIVRDTGSGIPEHAKARLFDAFSQASAADARRDGGVGLGLAIVARLVDAMKGEISVMSAWGEGSLFRVDVPLDPSPLENAAPPARIKSPSRREISVALSLPPASRIACIAALADVPGLRLLNAESAADKSVRPGLPLLDAALPPAQIEAQARRIPTLVVLRPGDRSRIEQFRAMGCAGYLIRPLRAASIVERVRLAIGGAPAPEETAASAETPAPAPGSAGRVLIADDNQVNALLANRALSAAGFRVDTAATGAEALERLDENDYALVFMDIRMPVMDGLEATRRIRRRGGAGGSTPVIALTADIDPDLEEKANAAGISAIASKPIDPARLRELAAKWARPPERRTGPPGRRGQDEA